MSNIEYVGSIQSGDTPAIHTYRLKAGAVVHVHGVPVTIGDDVFATSATDLRVVPPVGSTGTATTAP